MPRGEATDPPPRVWADKRLWLMAAFGFAAGLPLPLSGFTLRQWLTEGQVSLAAIGLTANIGLAYTLKFLWAPLLDQVRPPGPWGRFGRRRGWLLIAQPGLALSCLGLAAATAIASPAAAVAAAALVAVFSATQDIAIDAWRIETFPARLQGAALAGYVWGYRMALLISGAGVIWFAGRLGWDGALAGVAVLLALGMLVTLAAAEPPALAAPVRGLLTPVREFLARPGAGLILAFVALFNLGEAMAGVMLAPFYRALGFDRAAVAVATGPFSLAATIAGIAAGGWLVGRLGLARALISTGLIQTAAMAMYVALAASAGNHAMLYGTVMTEAFVQGLATAAFVTYLSGLCHPAHTATQYALLSSIAAIASHTVGGLSGFLAAQTGWQTFYTLCLTTALPAMAVMLVLLRRYPPVEASKAGGRCPPDPLARD